VLDPVGALVHLQVRGRDDHLLDQQLDDPGLLGGEELVPDRVELRHGDRHPGLVQGRIECLGLRQDLGQEGRGTQDARR
jgi:hypothetical protein